MAKTNAIKTNCEMNFYRSVQETKILRKGQHNYCMTRLFHSLRQVEALRHDYMARRSA